MNKTKQRKRKFSLLKLLFAALAVFVLLGVFVVYFPAVLFNLSAELPGGPDAEGVSVENRSNLTDHFYGGNVNIVLLGFDSYSSRDQEQSLARPDTIMIASIDFNSARVALVNIPRDSYTRIHGTDIYDKINHSYVRGYYRAPEGVDPYHYGLETTILTIQEFLGGLPLHGYIKIDIAGAEEIIDNIGGFYYEVEEEVRSDFGQGRVLVEEGYQLLNGKKFMDYVRNRAVHQGGDTGRSQRQQEIMIALFDQFKSPAVMARLPFLYPVITNNVEMGLNPLQVAALGLFGLRIDTSEIETYIFSGQGQLSYQNGQNIWYLVIDEEDRVRIIKEVFGEDVDKRSLPALPGPVAPEPEEPEPDPGPEPETEPDLEPDEPVDEEPADPESEEPVDKEPDEDEPFEENDETVEENGNAGEEDPVDDADQNDGSEDQGDESQGEDPGDQADPEDE